MAKLLKFIAAILCGTALGWFATSWAASHQPPFGAVRSGAWQAWPGAGSPDIDPYALAANARSGRIPLAAAAGLRFFAVADDTGAALDGRCTYEVGGSTPPAQFWTLTLLDPAGFPVPNPANRFGFTSAEPVRDIDGAFRIAVAARARPGNWLPAPASGRFQLMLSFYDTPLSTALQSGSPAPALPSIVKGTCS